jgi:hypothetical protein
MYDKSGIVGISKKIQFNKMYAKPMKKCGGSVILLQWKRSGSEIYELNMCACYQTKIKRLRQWRRELLFLLR